MTLKIRYKGKEPRRIITILGKSIEIKKGDVIDQPSERAEKWVRFMSKLWEPVDWKIDKNKKVRGKTPNSIKPLPPPPKTDDKKGSTKKVGLVDKLLGKGKKSDEKTDGQSKNKENAK